MVFANFWSNLLFQIWISENIWNFTWNLLNFRVETSKFYSFRSALVVPVARCSALSLSPQFCSFLWSWQTKKPSTLSRRRGKLRPVDPSTANLIFLFPRGVIKTSTHPRRKIAVGFFFFSFICFPRNARRHESSKQQEKRREEKRTRPASDSGESETESARRRRRPEEEKTMGCCCRCLEILCAILLPPLGVCLRHGCCTVRTLIRSPPLLSSALAD